MADKGVEAQDRRLWHRWRVLGEKSRVAEPDVMLLAAYAEGRLTEAEAESVEAWLAATPEALSDLVAARSTDQPHLAEERMKARKPHMNEAFQASVELPDDDPDVKAGKPLHGRNLWPDNLPGFKEAVLDYHTTMTGFAALLASVFARGLKLPPDYFAQYYRKPMIQVRLLHYLSQDQQAALEGGDSRAHQDAGGFTMLQQDDVGGLEIKSKSGEWLIVPPVENSFVVNIGDSMRMWTNNRFASTLHRVVNHYGRERYSVGVFANPDYDTVLRPLATCVDAEHPPTFDKMALGEAMLFLYSRIWPSLGEPDKQSSY